MTQPASYGLIQLAGRQLLPNLWLALTLQRAGLLARHEVLHTAEERESLRPAEQLLRMLEDDGAGLGQASPNSRRLNEISARVWETQHAVLSIIDEAEADGDKVDAWIVHATGGNKLMSLGATQVAGHPRVAAVIYRSIEGLWSLVYRAEDGSLRDKVLADGEDGESWENALTKTPARLDSVPLRQLLTAHFHEPKVIVQGHEALAGPASVNQRVDLLSWLNSAVKSGRGFADFALDQSLCDLPPSDGDAFECFLAHILRQAGAHSVLWGVDILAANRTPMIEADVVACHHDRLVFYDAKIDKPTSTGKTAQIRAAHDTAREFGGLSARAVLVRPNWPATVQVLAFAEALGVRLIHSGSLANFVDNLIEPLGLSLQGQSSLMTVQQRMSTLSARGGGSVFLHRAPGAVGR